MWKGRGLIDRLLLVGNIASLVTQPHFKAKFGIDHLSEDDYANTKGWIVSITTAGAVFGCLGVCWFRTVFVVW